MKGLFGCFIFASVTSWVWSATFVTNVNETIHTGLHGADNEPINVVSYAEKVILTNFTGILHDRTFSLLPEITDLHITKSYITSVSPRTFSPLTKLKYLRLSYSNLPVIKNEWFRYCRSLKVININNNDRLERFDVDAFSNLPVEEISIMSEVKLPSILPGTFFKGSTSLKKIMIHKCDITGLEEDIFDTLNSLEFVSLANNHISYIRPRTFKSPSLRKLYLGWNEMPRFTGDEFGHLQNLDTLDISDNPVDAVNVEVIAQRAPRLKSLVMSNSYLSCQEKQNLLHSHYHFQIYILKKEVSQCQSVPLH